MQAVFAEEHVFCWCYLLSSPSSPDTGQRQQTAFTEVIRSVGMYTVL